MTFLLIFFTALSIMIFVHELGHFVMARINGLKVEEFGFGLPPRLIGKKIGETIYSINALPLGGFVRIWGMESRVKKDKERAFYGQPKAIQFLILSAGVVMNFLLAIGVFSVVYGIKGIPQPLNYVKIVEINDNTPASKAEIKPDTKIVKIKVDDQEIKTETYDRFNEIIGQNLGQEVILVSRGGEEFSVTPRKNPPEMEDGIQEGPLGVIVTDTKLTKVALWKRIPLGVWYGLKESFFWGLQIVKGLGSIIGSLFQGEVPKDFGGPIAIWDVGSKIYRQQGLLDVIHFFAIVSVNLAIVNVVPIPGTDGWHAGILSFETIRGKKLSEETKVKINQAAMIFILLLSALIIAADIKRFLL